MSLFACFHQHAFSDVWPSCVMQGQMTLYGGCSPLCLCAKICRAWEMEGTAWMFFFAFFQFTLLSHLLSFSTLSSSLRPLVHCLSYQPIHQWLLFFNKWRWLCPTGELKMSECRNAFFISLFLYPVSLKFSFHRSLTIFPVTPPPPTHTLSLSQEIGWLVSCWMVHITLPIVGSANRIVNVQTTLPVFTSLCCTPSILLAYTASALAGQIERCSCRGEAWSQ